MTRYRVHSRTVPRYRDGRVFLVGDAANVHSPAGAQGMNTGMQDAYNLAWKLALVERGLTDESLVDSYQAERHPGGLQLLRTADRMFSVFGGQNPLARLARGRVAPLLAGRVLTRQWVAAGSSVCWRNCACPTRTARATPRTALAGGTRPHRANGPAKPTC